jgi:hypothetical protein
MILNEYTYVADKTLNLAKQPARSSNDRPASPRLHLRGRVVAGVEGISSGKGAEAEAHRMVLA